MVKLITCDICGIEVGGNYDISSMIHYGDQPNYSDFYVGQKRDMDVCRKCEEQLRKAVNDTIKRLNIK